MAPGRPTSNSKSSKEPISEAIPYRVYDFCAKGTLYVSYDKDWKVVRADFIDPYRAKGRNGPPPEQEHLRETEVRLAQMQSILKEYQKRFPDKDQ